MRRLDSGSQLLAMISDGRTNASISAAVADLNRSGLVVDEFGSLHIDGHHVSVRIRGGIPFALVDGVRVAWREFRRALPRRPQ